MNTGEKNVLDHTHTQVAQEVDQFQKEPAYSLKHWVYSCHYLGAISPFHQILTVNDKDK